jgi:RNA polymerase sigma factor (sigma-70 family)
VIDDVIRQLHKTPKETVLWGELYKELRPTIYAAAYQLCRGDTATADDLTQEAFLKFLAGEHVKKVTNEYEMIGYLRAIVRRLFLDEVRRRGTHPTFSTDEIAPDELEKALQRTIRYSLSEPDVAIFQELSRDDRELLLRMIRGETTSEIADAMRLKYSAAAVRLYRLRKKLIRSVKS